MQCFRNLPFTIHIPILFSREEKRWTQILVPSAIIPSSYGKCKSPQLSPIQTCYLNNWKLILSFLLRCGIKAIWKGHPMRLELTYSFCRDAVGVFYCFIMTDLGKLFDYTSGNKHYITQVKHYINQRQHYA